jgi:hypothetical protein
LVLVLCGLLALPVVWVLVPGGADVAAPCMPFECIYAVSCGIAIACGVAGAVWGPRWGLWLLPSAAGDVNSRHSRCVVHDVVCVNNDGEGAWILPAVVTLCSL